MTRPPKVIRGSAFHTPARGAVSALIDCAIEVDGDGAIRSVTTPGDPGYEAVLARALKTNTLETLPDDTYLIPGLVDLHIHAPQWPQLGKALDAPLEDWLLKYTFPLEARFADHAYAAEIYDDLVATLLAHGTTTAVYFGSVDLRANVILAEACLRHGQRAIIGKVAMDHPETCPDDYRDASAEDAIADTRAFIAALAELQEGKSALVHPAITPRFIPSCTDALLHGLGALAAETGCHVQTHCSESDWEVAHVKDRLGTTDAEALRDFGLLTDKTVLAHSNFVTASDMDRIHEAGSAVAHCPLSNAYFANAVFPARHALERGLKVGLGSDISGGFSPSLFETARFALMASRLAEAGTDPALPGEDRGAGGAPLSTAEVFWLATRGGAEAISLPVGAFVEGLQFDAVAVRAGAASSGFRVNDDDTAQDIFEKLVLTASPSSISRVWVAGEPVAP
ncbi:MAG: guanine deaminase [Pseudomonadota bacterium]